MIRSQKLKSILHKKEWLQICFDNFETVSYFNCLQVFYR